MDLEFNEDQNAIIAGVEQIVSAYPLTMANAPAPVHVNPELEKELVASGFLDVARTEELGALEALLVIEGIARSPFAVESAGTALVLPLLGLGESPRPVALVGPPHNQPVRFLSPDGVAYFDCGDTIRRVQGSDLNITPVDTLYAYPMSRIGIPDVTKVGEALNVDPQEFRRLWRLGMVAEMVGAMQSSLDIVVEHVKVRKQFGQPLGALQAIQQRLAECAVLVVGSRFLMYEAAAQGTAEGAALAASWAQDASARLTYDTMQFHGAMSLTLEYPLHYWTYRLRVLTGELGGPGGNGVEGADLAWPMDKAISESFRGQTV